MNVKGNVKYFKSLPKIPRLGPKIWCLLLLLGIVLFVIAKVVALSFVAAMIVWLILRNMGAASDSGVDGDAESLFEGMRQRALTKLGVEEEEINIAPAIEFWAYDLSQRSSLSDPIYSKISNKRGKDGLWRSPDVIMHGFYFTENEIQHYYRYASLVCEATKEGTEVVSYKDVVSVKTNSEDYNWTDPNTGVADGRVKVHSEFFSLRNSGGEDIQCCVNNMSEAEAAVNALRALVKQKKNA